MSKLKLIDGNSIMFRAHYATAYGKVMQTKSGIYTNALFAFINMFEKIIDDNPGYVLVAFDTESPTFRAQQYTEYKAGRSDFPEILSHQVDLIKKYLKLRGIKHYEQDGYEADDIIGTFATLAKTKEEIESVDIYTSDRDFLQIVDDNVYLNLLKSGLKEVLRINKDNIKDNFGIRVDQVIDFKTMQGDPSDNIKGIPGVGEKTAIKLLSEYDNLDSIIQAALNNEIKGALNDKIKNSLDEIKTAKWLVTILTNVDFKLSFDELRCKEVDVEAINEFYNQYELYKFLYKTQADSTKVIESTEIELFNLEPLEEMVGEDIEIEINTLLNDVTYTSIDTKQFIFDDDLVFYIDVKDTLYNDLTIEQIYGVGISSKTKNYFIKFAELVDSLEFYQYLQNALFSKTFFDLKMFMVLYNRFSRFDLMNVAGKIDDLKISAYLYDTRFGSTGLAGIIDYFLENNIKNDDQKTKKTLSIDLLSQGITQKTSLIKKTLELILKKLNEREQLTLLYELEIPLAIILAKMECRGILVNTPAFEQATLQLEAKCLTLLERFNNLTKNEININSPKQLAQLLYHDLKLSFASHKTGDTKTDVDNLRQLKLANPEIEIIDIIMDYRILHKIYSTYAQGLFGAIKNNEIHTIYLQTQTTTGRLSSINPNLQNIVSRQNHLTNINIRDYFIARPEYVLMSCDYSQIELRILASFANEQKMIDAFNKGIDIHEATATEVFAVDGKPTSKQRKQAKGINFGIIYGMGATALASQIDVSVKEARQYIDEYYQKYPLIKRYLLDLSNSVKNLGYAKTFFNRRRYIDLDATSFEAMSQVERFATNTPIQGSAADILKKAMIEIDNYLVNNKLKSSLLLTIHDEVILEVHNTEVQQLTKIIPEIMKNATRLTVSLETSCEIGSKWSDLK